MSVALVVVAGAVTWGLTGGAAPGGAAAESPTAAASSRAQSPGPARSSGAAPSPSAVASSVPAFDLAAHSTTDPDSLWVVVNKQHPISPLDHEPADLVTVDGARIRQVAQADLEAMLAAAETDGVRMGLRTGYRSYGAQAAIRADVEARRGFAHAERYSARPGYSEHQTGLAFDLHGTSQPGCDLQRCFADTVEARWVAARAAEYGFLVRYTPQNTLVTGYSPEAWHLRYVGRELAGWMATQGIGSLEKALGVTGGPDYAAGA